MAEEMTYDAMGNPTGVTVDPAAVAATQAAAETTRVNQAASEAFKRQFAEAVGINLWQMAGYKLGLTTAQDIISTKKPDEIINAFATVRPEWREAMTAVGAHPELKNALHAAITKDPSMLDGLASMATSGTGANPQEFLAAINDPTARQALTLTLNKIAEKPDDGNDFEDFQYLYNNRNDRAKVAGRMREMGIDMSSLMPGAGDIFGMLREALMSPTGFRDLMNKLPEMLGLSGEQGAAMKDALGMIGNYLDLCMGTKQDGFRALANQYGDTMVANGKDFFERISGQRDEEIARQRREASTGTHIDTRAEGLGPNPERGTMTAANRLVANVTSEDMREAAERNARYEAQLAGHTQPKLVNEFVPTQP